MQEEQLKLSTYSQLNTSQSELGQSLNKMSVLKDLNLKIEKPTALSRLSQSISQSKSLSNYKPKSQSELQQMFE